MLKSRTVLTVITMSSMAIMSAAAHARQSWPGYNPAGEGRFTDIRGCDHWILFSDAYVPQGGQVSNGPTLEGYNSDGILILSANSRVVARDIYVDGSADAMDSSLSDEAASATVSTTTRTKTFKHLGDGGRVEVGTGTITCRADVRVQLIDPACAGAAAAGTGFECPHPF